MTPPATAAAKSKPRRSAVVVKEAPAAAPAPRTRTRPARPAQRSGRFARRVSGPARKVSRPEQRVAAPARRAPAPAPARRTSGPARAAKSTRAVRGLPILRPLPVLGTIGSHAFRVGRSLPDSRLLDRLMRGRAWIVLIGVLLFGLVAINVSLLKLNSVAGRNAETVRTLRIQNTELQAKVSKLASAERLERAGRDLGLSMSIAGRVRYLSVRSSDGRRAARAIRTWETLPSFAFAPLPVAPVVAQTATPAPTGATGATGPAGVQTGTGVETGTPATGLPAGTQGAGTTSPQTTSGTTTTPTGTDQTAGAVTTPTPDAGGQALTTPTG